MQVTENSQPVGVKTLGDYRSPFVGQKQERLCGSMENLEEVVGQVPQDAPVSSSVGAAPFRSEPGLLSGLSHPSQCFLYSFLHGERGLLGNTWACPTFFGLSCSVSSDLCGSALLPRPLSCGLALSLTLLFPCSVLFVCGLGLAAGVKEKDYLQLVPPNPPAPLPHPTAKA